MKTFNQLMTAAGLIFILASCVTGRGDFSKRKYLNLERIKNADEEVSAFPETPTPDETTFTTGEVLTAILPEADPDPMPGATGNTDAPEISNDPATTTGKNSEEPFIPVNEGAYEPATMTVDEPNSATAENEETNTINNAHRWYNIQMWTILLAVATFATLSIEIGDGLTFALIWVGILLFFASFIYGLLHVKAMKEIPTHERSNIQKLNYFFSCLFLVLAILAFASLTPIMIVITWYVFFP